jgi:tripartite-type tricarboxylate transporter receptor subunit TctC
VAEIAAFGNAVIVNPAVPVHNVKELVTWAKSQTNGGSYGSWGVGTAGHLAMEMVRTSTNAPLVHIPYKGTAPVLTDVMGGQLPVGVTGVIEIEQAAKAGKIRVIAVTGSKRSPNFPDIPTLAEQGVPFATDSWFALFAPARTPSPVVAKLRAAIATVGADKDLQKSLIGLGMIPSTIGPDEFAAVQRKDLEVWAQLVKSSGAKAD